MTSQEPNLDASRAEQRRQQIINAAVECFRRGGFHGASMSEISKAAGMSVGHIYHYFANKEALIAAIVERDIVRALDIAESLAAASAQGELAQAMADQVEMIVDERLCRDRAGLDLEMLAEASRNPKVAEIVHSAERTMRKRFHEVADLNRRARGLPQDPLRDARMDLLSALFGGLTMRAIEHPALDHAAIVPLLKVVASFIIEFEPDKGGMAE